MYFVSVKHEPHVLVSTGAVLFFQLPAHSRSQSLRFFELAFKLFKSAEYNCFKRRIKRRMHIIRQSSVRKKMAAVHLTTIPCEPNTVHMEHRKPCFCEIYPRTNNIVYAGFQGCGAFLCAFMRVFAIFARYAL